MRIDACVQWIGEARALRSRLSLWQLLSRLQWQSLRLSRSQQTAAAFPARATAANRSARHNASEASVADRRSVGCCCGAAIAAPFLLLRCLLLCRFYSHWLARSLIDDECQSGTRTTRAMGRWVTVPARLTDAASTQKEELRRLWQRGIASGLQSTQRASSPHVMAAGSHSARQHRLHRWYA